MRTRWLLLPALLAAACNDPGPNAGPDRLDASPPVDGETTTPDAGTTSPPDAGTTTTPPDGTSASPDAGTIEEACATPALGTITGYSLDQFSGSSGYARYRADLVWTLASTTTCVDHYLPSGTLSAENANNEGTFVTPLGPIASTDGELVIDRSTSPATYTMHGSTGGKRWAAQQGWFDGLLIAGGGYSHSHQVRWEMASAAFHPPGVGCVGAAVDTVATTSEDEIRADVTWRRTETSGCVDHYTIASGTGTEPEPFRPEHCVAVSYSSTSGAIVGDELDTLTIDRSANPPRVQMEATSWWEVDRTCTLADGTTTTERVTLGGDWARVFMAFDGQQWGGRVDLRPEVRFAASWSFTLP